MPTTPSPKLSIFEFLRLWAGGREYSERRIPELLAELVAAHQDSNQIVGAISNWLRTNLRDQNQIAAIYFVAKFLKRRRTPLFMAAAEALEGLPALADEVQELPEVRNATNPTERGAHFGEQIATRFTSLFEAAKNRLATNASGAAMPISSSIRSGGSAIRNGVSSFFSSIGNMAEGVGEKIVKVLQFTGFWIGFAILYCVLIIVITFWFPTAMQEFAWFSFFALIVPPTIGVMFGAFLGNPGVAIQLGSGGVLSIISSSLLFVAFALAAACGVYTGESCWDILIMGTIIIVVWDRVVFGLIQKAISTPTVMAKFVGAIANDGTVDPRERVSIDEAKRSAGLVNVSSTVAGATNIGWLVLIIIHTLQHPIAIPLAACLIALQVVIGTAYARTSLKLAKSTDYPEHLGLKPLIQMWSQWLYERSMALMVTVPTAAILIIVGYFYITPQTAGQWWENLRATSISATERTATVVVNAVDQGAAVVEKKVNKPKATTTTTTVQPAPAATIGAKTRPTAKKAAKQSVPPSKRNEDCRVLGGADYCASLQAQGLKNVYPCPCGK